MRRLLCASRNNDFDFYSSVLAGLRSAGSHCENSGSRDGSSASARSGSAKQRSLLCPLSERGCRHPLLFAVLDLLVLLDQAKSTEEKMHDRRNRFLLREVSRTSDWAFPARSGFTTFCHRKVAPKVSAEHLRRDRTEQCGICGALRATMIIC